MALQNGERHGGCRNLATHGKSGRWNSVTASPPELVKGGLQEIVGGCITMRNRLARTWYHPVAGSDPETFGAGPASRRVQGSIPKQIGFLLHRNK